MNQQAQAQQGASDAPEVESTKSGRRHLDGSPPGDGHYMQVVALSMRPDDIAALEQIGDGNRSLAVRRLLAQFRETQPTAATAG